MTESSLHRLQVIDLSCSPLTFLSSSWAALRIARDRWHRAAPKGSGGAWSHRGGPWTLGSLGTDASRTDVNLPVVWWGWFRRPVFVDHQSLPRDFTSSAVRRRHQRHQPRLALLLDPLLSQVPLPLLLQQLFLATGLRHKKGRMAWSGKIEEETSTLQKNEGTSNNPCESTSRPSSSWRHLGRQPDHMQQPPTICVRAMRILDINPRRVERRSSPWRSKTWSTTRCGLRGCRSSSGLSYMVWSSLLFKTQTGGFLKKKKT